MSISQWDEETLSCKYWVGGYFKVMKIVLLQLYSHHLLLC